MKHEPVKDHAERKRISDLIEQCETEQTMKCCGNCEYRRQSKLKIQFNEIPITAYCDNENSPYYDKYVWDDEICDEWKGADGE